jgi:hypothetical protein
MEKMISVISKTATMAIEYYNPAYVIDTVNTLQPLGKENAIKQIYYYLDHRDESGDACGLFWLLRALFNLPAKQKFPPVRIGQPSIPPPVHAEKLLRFPVLIIKDIPFLVVQSYLLGGMPESVENHIAYFQAHGILRKHQLAPPSSLDDVEESFLRLWKSAYGDAYVKEAQGALKAQISRLSGRYELKDSALRD